MSEDPASPGASPGKEPATSPASPAPIATPLAWLPWIAAVGLALLLGFLGQAYFAARSELTAMREQAALTDIENQTLKQRMEAERILLAHQMAGGSAGAADISQLQIVPLATPDGAKPIAAAFVIWDARRRQGELAVFQLPGLPRDQNYRVWISDPQNPEAVSAGMFTVPPTGGDARVSLRPAKPVAGAARFTIAVESVAGEPGQPGQVVLSSR